LAGIWESNILPELASSIDAESAPLRDDLSPAEHLLIEGNRLMSCGSSSEAESCFREAIRLAPGFAQAHNNLGLVLEQQGAPAEAEHHFLRSIALNPDSAKSQLNLGALLADQKRFSEAESAYRRALELVPDSPAAWSNLGVLQACCKREEEAEQSHRKAIDLDPQYRTAYFNLSYLLLRQGRFEEGWRCLEAREWYARLEQIFTCPRWRGESLQGRSVLIGFEAGHGDMIQFCRFAALLKARGAARITLIGHPALKTLLATHESIDAVFAFDDAIPSLDVDFWTPPLSIPYYCQIRADSIPAELPYLRPNIELVERWSSLLQRECGSSDFRVGFVWKGNALFENDGERSIHDIKLLEPLARIGGVRLISLQKGAGEEEARNTPAGLPLLHLGSDISDFADSAAIVSNLDLVISVDTAMAHLAGALGKQCWVLLPDYKTDWRWLVGRSDSPWYPQVMRLFRQPHMGGWAEVITEVCVELRSLVAARRRTGA
jgi:Flp pilus assembly protein TadD